MIVIDRRGCELSSVYNTAQSGAMCNISPEVVYVMEPRARSLEGGRIIRLEGVGAVYALS